jgi:hypothetical protein
LKRLREELRRHNVTAAVIFDPINIRPRRQFQVASLPMTRSTAQRVLIFFSFFKTCVLDVVVTSNLLQSQGQLSIN